MMAFKWPRRGLLGLAALLALPLLSSAFYLPGVAPTSYIADSKVPLYVNHLTPGLSSEDRQLHSVFSFDYYYSLFQFCQPEGGAKRVSESLGSILFGDRIYTSAYELRMLKNESCRAVCGARKFDAESAQFVNERIWQSYNLNWLIDGLPAAQPATDPATQTEYFTPGFLLGSVVDGQPQLHNHVDLTIDYHAVGGGRMRVVGVLAQPSSRRDARVPDDGGGKADCGDAAAPLLLSETADTPVTWTYSVSWRPSGQAWATRWDKYLHVFDPRIHWFSLIYSAGIVLCLTGLVGMILVRVLRKDIARYNRLDSFDLGSMNGTSAALDDGVQEDSGWKLVHGDVFRAPSHPLILSILLGNGAQLFVMAGVTILFAMLGFLSPSNRGSIGTIAVLLYTILGFVGGYVSARAYKVFGGDAWKRNISLTPVLVPGIVFGTFFILNLFLWAKRSSGAVPFTTMLVIAGIWFTITVPLSVVGSWVGFKQPVIAAPVRTNQIPRQIPPGPAYLRPAPSLLAAGLLPFAAIFVELYFIMASIWSGRLYYMFGFLFVCYGLMIITSAAVTILLVYFLLCAENYHWQWRAFCGAGASGAYVFANALLYWASRVSLGGFAGNVLYLGYSALISFLFFILTGTIGFIASWLFIYKIYGSIKVD